MSAPTKTARKGTPARRAAARPANGNGKAPANGSVPHPATQVKAAEEYVPTPDPVPAAPPAAPEAPKIEHPYPEGTKLYVHKPSDGSEPIVFPHISTCQPTTVFFYDHRNDDQLQQAFAWMDLCGIPDYIGRRVFMLPAAEQGTVLREWFSGLALTPQQEVSPPGES